MGILETKVKVENIDEVVKNCTGDGDWKFSFCLDDEGLRSRIIVIWKHLELDVQVAWQDKQVICCKVTFLDKTFWVGFVYASINRSVRREFWEHMLNSCSEDNGWVLMGDFNCIKNLSERWGGARVRRRDYEDLAGFNESTSFEDLPYSGSFYTWTNKQLGEAKIASKLDRCLANEKWRELFLHYDVLFSNPGISDHCPCILSIGKKKKKSFSFRYYNFWEKESNFLDIVKEA